MSAPKDAIDGTVRDLSRFGEGVVATERGVVFAPGVLPGERVSLEGVKKEGKVLRASRVRVLDATGQRREPLCPLQGRCGGCPLMIASPVVQSAFKQGLLERALVGLPGADGLERGWIGARHDHAYRRRARMKWARDTRGRRLLGFGSARSHAITDVLRCVVLHPVLDAGLGHVRERLLGELDGEGELHLAIGAGERAVVALRSDAPQPPTIYEALRGLVESGALAGAAIRVAGATIDATFGDPREHRVGHDNEPFIGTVAGFSQPHDEVNRALVGAVVELARPEKRRVLELFSGSGNLTIALARLAKEVEAVESDAAACDACRANLAARGLDAVVRAADAESYRPKSDPEVVVLDPPRTGAAGAIERIVVQRIPEVVYVSCDPPTLRRDLTTLTNAGYRITDALALDMFPQTAHVECVVRLTR
ncbi:MAG: class I SAM-dependent RNA methyltransferase [Sandaracinaceae bacterium]